MPTSSKDLWAAALEKLTKSDRPQLTFYNGQDRLDILSDLQVLTESAKINASTKDGSSVDVVVMVRT